MIAGHHAHKGMSAKGKTVNILKTWIFTTDSKSAMCELVISLADINYCSQWPASIQERTARRESMLDSIIITPPRWGRRVLRSVSLSVCLSASVSMEPLDRSWWNLWRTSPGAVARCSFSGVAICYVLPVLWMTSRLAVVGCMAMRG